MNVVLDTNVFLSALITPDGPSGRVVDAWMRDRRYSLILSQPTLDEFERVLTRPKFGRLLRRTPDWLSNMQHEFRMGVTFVESTPVKVILQDPPDDLFLGTALAGAADYLVSGNKHLLELVQFEGIPILPPRRFLDLLELEREEP